MRLFALTALVLAPVATFAQAANQYNLEARLKAPAAISAATPAATPSVSISTPSYHDVLKASLTSPEMDKAVAEGGTVSYSWPGDAQSQADFKAPKLTSVVGRKLPLTDATTSSADVVVNLIVDNHGVPAEVKIVKSAGSAAVDASTIAAVKRYRFQPATYNNLPVYAHLSLEISLEK